MTGIHPKVNRQELIDRALDRLSPISLADVRMKLAHSKEGKDWDDTILDWVEQEYRRFLALNYAYSDRTIVPDKAVDEFWHHHILDTHAYANDTMMVFGYFLHHFPYLGLRGPEDEEKLVQYYSDTKDLYEFHFGQSNTEESNIFSKCSSCGGGKCSSCARVGN